MSVIELRRWTGPVRRTNDVLTVLRNAAVRRHVNPTKGDVRLTNLHEDDMRRVLYMYAGQKLVKKTYKY